MNTALRLRCAALVATFVALATVTATGTADFTGPSAEGSPIGGFPHNWGWE